MHNEADPRLTCSAKAAHCPSEAHLGCLHSTGDQQSSVIPPQTPAAEPYLKGFLTLSQLTWKSSPEQKGHCLQNTLVHFNKGYDTLLSLSLNIAAVNGIY